MPAAPTRLLIIAAQDLALGDVNCRWSLQRSMSARHMADLLTAVRQNLIASIRDWRAGGGFISAWRASNMRPTDALRLE